MPSAYWVKLYIEILDDPKIGLMPDWLFRRFIELLLAAGENRDEGKLQPVTNLAWRLRIPEKDLVKALRALEEIGVAHEAQPNEWVVTNFKKRQEAATGAERIEHYRERKRRDNEQGNDGVTKRYKKVTQNVTDTDTDTDQEMLPKNGNGKPPPASKELKEPWVHRIELEKYFCEVSGLAPPNHSDIKGTQKLWWTPLDTIWGLVGKDTAIACELIKAACHELRDLTYSDPNSIVKTARSIHARNHRPTDNHGYTHP